MTPVELVPTDCAICRSPGNAREIYPPNFAPGAFNAGVFSARRLPDRIHYRIVRCTACGLVRSDPVADSDTLASLYARSTFDYGGEVAGLRQTYGRYLSKLDRLVPSKDALLEIGCGNGFFLEEALDRGYRSVRGVEPSHEAVSQSADRVRPYIVSSTMRPGIFDPGTFDTICLFQVFDHISDPNALLDECLRILKPGGVLLILNHNVTSFSARLLGERSPIIDIEHTYLYSPSTLARLLEAHRFDIVAGGPVANTYSLKYLVRLVPFPSPVKRVLLSLFERGFPGSVRLTVPLGNLFVAGRKPR